MRETKPRLELLLQGDIPRSSEAVYDLFASHAGSKA